MKTEYNYFPMIVINGEEWVSLTPMDCATAFSTAIRMKAERNAEYACVKVFEKDRMRIDSWKMGKYRAFTGIYLYRIDV